MASKNSDKKSKEISQSPSDINKNIINWIKESNIVSFAPDKLHKLEVNVVSMCKNYRVDFYVKKQNKEQEASGKYTIEIGKSMFIGINLNGKLFEFVDQSLWSKEDFHTWSEK